MVGINHTIDSGFYYQCVCKHLEAKAILYDIVLYFYMHILTYVHNFSKTRHLSDSVFCMVQIVASSKALGHVHVHVSFHKKECTSQ